MKGFYSRDKKILQEKKEKEEKEKVEQEMKKFRNLHKIKIPAQDKEFQLFRHSKILEAQNRIKALQKQEKNKGKDNFDYFVNFVNNKASGVRQGNNENIRALDLQINFNSKIPKPSLEKKVLVNTGIEETKIPKIFKPLPEIPEIPKRVDSMPWKKGDLLDSLDLGTTNLKKLFQNRPKLCDSPGRQNQADPDWLKENFRTSINEWAPKKIETFTNIKPTKRVLTKNLIKIGTVERPDLLKAQIPKVEKQPDKVFKSPQISQGSKAVPSPRPVLISKEEQKEPKKEVFDSAKGKISNENFKSLQDKEKQVEIENKQIEGPNDLISPKLCEENEIVLKGGKKQSKFVNKIKTIPENNGEFLDCELECVLDEEERLKASLARLDLKYIRLKNQGKQGVKFN